MMPHTILVNEIKKCITHGDFTLSSGKKSDTYVDLRKLMMRASGFEVVGRMLTNATFGIRFECVGGMATAAVPVVCSMLAWSKEICGFYMRRDPKEHGLTQRIEGHLIPKSNVIVVDDVATSGRSMIAVIDYIRLRYACNVVAAVCILDRQEGATEALAAIGVNLISLAKLEDLK